MSNGIILDGRRIKAYEFLYELGEYAGRESDWLDNLWEELVSNSQLMKEFMYYIDYHNFLDEYSISGYCLTDIYVFQMNRYNLISDTGKNTNLCNKESMVLGAFYDFAQMQKNPDKYIKKFSNPTGMDRLY